MGDKQTEKGLHGTFMDRGWEPPLFELEHDDAERLLVLVTDIAETSTRQAQTDLWRLGDIAVWIEDAYGADYLEQWAPEGDFVARTYDNLMRICRAFADRSRRWPPDKITVWTHGDVAAKWIDHETADMWLADLAAGEIADRDGLRDVKRTEKAKRQRSKDQKTLDDAATDDWPECPKCEGGTCGHCGGACGLCRGTGKLSPERAAALEQEELVG